MSGTYYKRKVVARKPKYKYKYHGLKNGKEVTDPKLIEELNNIKIPGTYTNVILTNRPAENGLEATGYDGTGRKQYFYNKKHLADSRKEKYQNLIFLGMNLPKIIKDIDTLRSKSKPDNDSLNAMALLIMMKCNFRVGSLNNQKKYGTYGLSTLTTDHVKFHKGGVTIKFNGKKQQVNENFLDDKEIVAMLKKLVSHNKKNTSSSSGSASYLFSWNGTRVTPDTLNVFLGKYHPDITTKTWRTWFANTRYLKLMRNEDIPESKTLRKRISNQVVKIVAEELHHTPAICKKNYLMTELIDLYVENPEKWKSSKSQNPDLFFTDFLKSHYSITKDWIRKRSRSRESSRTRNNTVGGALAGPTWKPELASHKPGYTGRKSSKEGFLQKSPNTKKDKHDDDLDLDKKYLRGGGGDDSSTTSSESSESNSSSSYYSSDESSSS
jgi:DNA topoisomerase-1